MRTLLENPIILIILIGAISSVYKRMKEANPEKERKSLFPTGPLVITQEREQKYPEGDRGHARSIPGNSHQVKENRPKRQASESWGATTQQAPLEYETIKASEENEKMPQDRFPREQTTQSEQLEVDSQTLIDGFIWSEVLGPPRAKRPYRAVRK